MRRIFEVFIDAGIISTIASFGWLIVPLLDTDVYWNTVLKVVCVMWFVIFIIMIMWLLSDKEQGLIFNRKTIQS